MDVAKKVEVERGRLVFIAFVAGMALGAFAPTPAHAAKNCSKDGTAGLSVVNTGPQKDFSSIPLGYTVCSLGESNTNQIFQQVELNGRTLINSAQGGCAIGNYARFNSTKGKSCWANMPKSCDVIWIKPINRSKGIDPNVYVAAVEQDLVTVLGEIGPRISGVKEVHLSGHHATPYSDVNSRGAQPKQGEPYSHDSIFAIQNVIAQYQGAYSFDLVLGTNLWAKSDVWTCGDFRDDGVHLSYGSNGGNAKAAGMLVGNSTPPPPPGDDPPPPPPQECPVPRWAERKGYTCSFNERQQRCVCRPPR